MAAVPPPPSDLPPAPPPRPAAKPWRAIVVTVFVLALVLVGIAAYLYFSDRIEPSTWALTMTQVTDLQARGLDGTGVHVCIVDTGVDLTHPELQGVKLIAWHDFTRTPSPPDPYDDDGHGTAMAGIIFARGSLHGVAPSAGLIAVKAITSSGSGTDAAVADSIRFCLDPNGNGNLRDDGANVISLSLGGTSHGFLGSQTATAAKEALADGVYVVAAAGNDGPSGPVESPASEAGVIAVGAVDSQAVIAPFSPVGSASYGNPDEKPEVVAPGVYIAVPLSGGRYAYVSGTSPAAALVSGIVALELQDRPSYRWSPTALAAFKTALMDSAMPEPGQQVPHDPRYGYGLVQAAAWDARL